MSFEGIYPQQRYSCYPQAFEVPFYLINYSQYWIYASNTNFNKMPAGLMLLYIYLQYAQLQELNFLVFTVNLTPVGTKARNFTFNNKPAGFCIAYYVLRYFNLFVNLLCTTGTSPFCFQASIWKPILRQCIPPSTKIILPPGLPLAH